MYSPNHYKSEDKNEAIAFMQRFNFGILVSLGDAQPEATHLPFSVREKGEDIILTAHLAKANPQWTFFNKDKVLAIFSEPHAYISPAFYNKKQNVPTWNYLAVHAYGLLEIVNEEHAKEKILEDLIEDMEPAYQKQWEGLSPAYKSGMMKGIVAFKIKVTDLQFQKKLSQNKKEEEKNRIIASFEKSEEENERSIGAYMKTPQSGIH